MDDASVDGGIKPTVDLHRLVPPGASPTEVAELVSASKPFISCHGEESPSRVPWKRSLPDLLKGKAALGKQTNHMQSNQKGMLLCPKP
eukprot:scaffold200359_cov13-Tisochrysis_lutea.AAC.1